MCHKERLQQGSSLHQAAQSHPLPALSDTCGRCGRTTTYCATTSSTLAGAETWMDGRCVSQPMKRTALAVAPWRCPRTSRGDTSLGRLALAHSCVQVTRTRIGIVARAARIGIHCIVGGEGVANGMLPSTPKSAAASVRFCGVHWVRAGRPIRFWRFRNSGQ